jgi:hypothetical protein
MNLCFIPFLKSPACLFRSLILAIFTPATHSLELEEVEDERGERLQQTIPGTSVGNCAP